MSIVRWRRVRQRLTVVVTHALVAGQLLIGLPAFAAPKDAKAAKPVPAPETSKVKVNRTLPAVKPVPEYPIFSENPTTEEIRRARVFGEPLLANGEPSFEENKALADAVTTWLHSGQTEDVGILEGFLTSYPQSAWRSSLLLNVGLAYRRAGRYAKALAALEDVWSHGQAPKGAVGDRALEDLIELYMKFDPSGRLASLLEESKGRDVSGPTAQKIRDGESAVWVMNEHHDWAIPSGPLALDKVLQQLRPGYVRHPKIAAFKATHDGASIVQIRDLAQSAGLSMQLAQWESGAKIPIPSVAHYKLGHYTAIVSEANGKYLLDDPILDGPLWVSRQALEEEASGYFLIPAEKLPEGFRPGDEKEAAKLRGKCHTATPYPGALGPDSPGPVHGPSSPGLDHGPSCNHGMAGYSLRSMLVDVNISDTPVGYTPPIGPAVDFTVDYNDRELLQPKTFYFSNLGSQWTFNWMSWVTDDPTNPSGPAQVYLRRAGQEAFTGFDPATGSYARWPQNQAQLVRTSSSPVRYERRLSDGSVEVFGLPDGAATSPRRVFLTQVIDPQGNVLSFSYDNLFRLVAVQDAIGQVTTLSYDFSDDPLKITKVTDPFQRSASFEYNALGQLTAIVDVIGLRSQFTYGSSNFISALTTPYGTTRFQRLDTTLWRKVEVTDPLGGVEHMEGTALDGGVTPATEPANLVPSGFAGDNGGLHTRNTYYWNKIAWSRSPGDYTKAQITHWKWGRSQLDVTDVIGSEKLPLENRVWYGQTGENQPDGIGPVARPARIGRVLDDGTSQISRFEYNALGNVTRKTDPVGLETIYEYTPDSYDLLSIKQKNGASYDLVGARTYDSHHNPLTITDAAGQVTTYAYDDKSRLTTVVTPARAGLSQSDRTTTLSYFPGDAPTGAGRLQSVAVSSNEPTAYTYDGYGRVRTVTNAGTYVITYDYDALDRVTRTTYPDTTYEESQYERLDSVRRRDRLGRWSYTFYDSLRRPTATRDPAGRTISKTEWVSCTTGCVGGRVSKWVDANGNATTWEYDIQGRVVKETRANGAFKTFVYEDTTSRPKMVVDAKAQEKHFTYSISGQLLAITYLKSEHATSNVMFNYSIPGTSSTDPYGRLRQIRDAAGATTYSYYPFGSVGGGRLETVAGPLAGDVVTYGYDEVGRLVSQDVNGAASTWQYDAQGRLLIYATPVGHFTYLYNGNLPVPSSLVYPNGQSTEYVYDSAANGRRLTDINHKSPSGATLSRFGYTYDALGHIVTRLQTTDQGAQLSQMTYDQSSQLTTVALKNADSPQQLLKRFYYSYDPSGNRLVAQTDDAAVVSAYDNMNRLVESQASGAVFVSGAVNETAHVTVDGRPAAVDAGGHFEGAMPVQPGSSVVIAAKDFSVPPNVRTNTYQIGQPGSATRYTYDANGNTTSDGARSYDWDAENRLIRVSQGSTDLATFKYDAAGRRIEKTAGAVKHSYVYAGAHIAEERLGSGELLRYFHLGADQWVGRQEPDGSATFFLQDLLGSVTQQTNASGQITLARTYDPWGNLDASSIGVAGPSFTGRDWDPEIGRYYYRARYYDPGMGRFSSEDPIGLRGGANLFDYVNNLPTSAVDPTGMVSWACHVEVEQAGLIGVGAHLSATCISSCGGGRSLVVEVAGWGGGISIGLIEVTGTDYFVRLEDPFQVASESSLRGNWFAMSALSGAFEQDGGSYSGTVIGFASTPDFSWGGQHGYDLSLFNAVGGWVTSANKLAEGTCCGR